MTTPIWTFVPKFLCLPFHARCISGSHNHAGIDERVLLYGHAGILEMGFDTLENLLAKVVLLEQVPKRQDRRLVMNQVGHHVDLCETADGDRLDHRIFHDASTFVMSDRLECLQDCHHY